MLPIWGNPQAWGTAGEWKPFTSLSRGRTWNMENTSWISRPLPELLLSELLLLTINSICSSIWKWYCIFEHVSAHILNTFDILDRQSILFSLWIWIQPVWIPIHHSPPETNASFSFLNFISPSSWGSSFQPYLTSSNFSFSLTSKLWRCCLQGASRTSFLFSTPALLWCYIVTLVLRLLQEHTSPSFLSFPPFYCTMYSCSQIGFLKSSFQSTTFKGLR